MLSICKSSRMGKIEKPRPLRTNSTPTVSTAKLEAVLCDVERMCRMLGGEQACSVDTLSSSVTSVWYHVKLVGAQLDHVYKSEMDGLFGVIRQACGDETLDRACRVRLLELIELRAQQCPWAINTQVSNYYRQQLLLIENEQQQQQQQQCFLPTNVGGGGGVSGVAQQLTTPPPPAPPTGAAELQPPPLPALLSDGEVVRGSGRYPRPLNVAGHYKDEVVIRNSDSGKVEHGTRERMVQIRGETEDNVILARHLIDDVIRHNASPELRRLYGSSSLNNSSNTSNSNSNNSSLSHAVRSCLDSSAGGCFDRSSSSYFSTGRGDAVQTDCSGVGGAGGGCLGEFGYTARILGHDVRLSGTNVHAVNMAKLVLDEYFCSDDVLVNNTPHNLQQQHQHIDEDGGLIVKRSHSLPVGTADDCDVKSHDHSLNNTHHITTKQQQQQHHVSDISSPMLNESILKSAAAGGFLATSSPLAQQQQQQLLSTTTTAATTLDTSRSSVAGAGDDGGAGSLILGAVDQCLLDAAGDHSVDETPVAKRSVAVYTRDQLLKLSSSWLSRQQPANWLLVQVKLPVARSSSRDFDYERFVVVSAGAVPAVLQRKSRSPAFASAILPGVV